MNTLESLMKECNNYFYRWKETNTFTIENGTIEVEGTYLVGQYIKLTGSIMNDGVYKAETVVDNTITILGLINEVFYGIIYGLAIPKEFISLSDRVEEYNIKNVISNKSSEGFNNYSVGYATNGNGKPMQWQDIFKADIDTYRQIYTGERWVIGI